MLLFSIRCRRNADDKIRYRFFNHLRIEAQAFEYLKTLFKSINFRITVMIVSNAAIIGRRVVVNKSKNFKGQSIFIPIKTLILNRVSLVFRLNEY